MKWKTNVLRRKKNTNLEWWQCSRNLFFDNMQQKWSRHIITHLLKHIPQVLIFLMTFSPRVSLKVDSVAETALIIHVRATKYDKCIIHNDSLQSLSPAVTCQNMKMYWWWNSLSYYLIEYHCLQFWMTGFYILIFHKYLSSWVWQRVYLAS